jgi:hypothetical protein
MQPWSDCSSNASPQLFVFYLSRYVPYQQVSARLTCCKWRAMAVRISSSSSSAKRTALSILLLDR